MNVKQIIAILILLVGVGMIVYSVQQMDTLKETVAMKVKGKYSNHTMTSLIGGIAMVILGGSGAIIFRCCRKKK